MDISIDNCVKYSKDLESLIRAEILNEIAILGWHLKKSWLRSRSLHLAKQIWKDTFVPAKEGMKAQSPVKAKAMQGLTLAFLEQIWLLVLGFRIQEQIKCVCWYTV